MRPEDFPAWQKKVREAMEKLMKFPLHDNLPTPVLVKTVQREHYRVEKWEAYPLPGRCGTVSGTCSGYRFRKKSGSRAILHPRF